MGQIRDKHKSTQDKKRSDNDPLTGELGNRDESHNKFDIDEQTIRDQKNKGRKEKD